jgi:hypothetical protein
VEHEALYREDEEAVFWSTPEECAQKCARLLDDPEWRLRIGKQARLRCVQNETTNEKVLERILARVAPGSSRRESMAISGDN